MKKKINLCILLILSLFIFSGNVGSAPTASSNLDYSTCIAFSDVFKTISTTQGEYYYKYCYRATCSNGVYNKANMVANSGYRCQNGNGTPYTKVTGDGCSSYSGTCSTRNSTYCTKVTYIDCNRKKDGSDFNTTTKRTTTTTKKTTTKKTTTTTKRTTTRKTTTRKTTTKKTTTTTKRVTTTKETTTTTKTTTTTTVVKSNNTNIKLIQIGKEKTEIDNSKDTFTVKVPFGVENVDVKVTLEDKNAKYTVNGNNMMPEENHSIIITVIAEDGTKRVVTLNVERYVAKSSECRLANIYTEDYAIDFSKNVYQYTLKLPKNVTSLDLETVLVDEEKATYEIEGNSKLQNKSKIKIIILAEDGMECIYTIKIKKSSNTWKYIVLIILLLGALGTAVYFLFKYLKKSKGKYKYE